MSGDDPDARIERRTQQQRIAEGICSGSGSAKTHR